MYTASRLQRWSGILSAHDYEIKFNKTDKNIKADFLSRLPFSSSDIYYLDFSHILF